MGPRYQLTNLSPPRVSEPPSLLLCSAPHSPFLTIAFFSLPNSSANEPRITPPFPPCLKRPPHGFPLAAALSLSLSAPAFRHSDILWLNARDENPRFVFFLFPHSKRVAAALLLAESALFTLLSLLFAADSGARRARHCFFSSLYAFCHLADLRFSFFFLSFSHQARVLRPQQSLSADADPLSSNILALLLDASTVGTRAEDLSPSTGIPAAVLKQALYDSKGTSPRSTRPLPSSWQERLRLRQGRRQASSVEYSPNGCHATKRVLCRDAPSVSITFHQLTSAGRVSSSRPRWPRLATIFLRISKNAEHRGVEAGYRR